MISFRFHLVSLVAVFLALGLGILTGTTVLNRGIVTQLERQTDRLSTTSERLREDVRALQAENEGWTGFGAELGEFLLSGRLTGEDVVLVTQEGTDPSAIERVRTGIETAGAELGALVAVDPRMAAQTPDDAAELARIVGTEATDPDEILAVAADVVGQRLVSRPEADDPLERLLEAGFLRNRGPGLGTTALHELGGPRQVAIVVAGGQGDPTIDPARFLVPLVQSLAARGARVGAAETLRSEYAFVGLVRSDPAFRARLVTQDNVDQMPGQISFVLAMDALVDGARAGHYGVKDGADAAAPPLS